MDHEGGGEAAASIGFLDANGDEEADDADGVAVDAPIDVDVDVSTGCLGVVDKASLEAEEGAAADEEVAADGVVGEADEGAAADEEVAADGVVGEVDGEAAADEEVAADGVVGEPMRELPPTRKLPMASLTTPPST